MLHDTFEIRDSYNNWQMNKSKSKMINTAYYSTQWNDKINNKCLLKRERLEWMRVLFSS